MVGCVVVKDDRIVGEGYHRDYGQAHAEVNALIEAGADAKGATLYVTLEPCAHEGKTPPCTQAIINAGVARVVYAVADPNPQAAGGDAVLRRHGIETLSGIEEPAAKRLSRFFMHHVKTRRPYVIAKYATSLDGKIASHTGHSQWITGALARQRSHELRQAVDGIVIGAQTVINDNPSLTVRLPETTLATKHVRNPVRFVLDSSGRVPLNSTLFQSADQAETHVITTAKMSVNHEQLLTDSGVTVTRIADNDLGQVSIPAMLDTLGAQNIQSLMIEGGQKLLGAFMDSQCINESWAFFAPKFIGGDTAPGPIGGTGVDNVENAATLTNVVHEQLGSDWLIRGDVHYCGGPA
jgi:diaminohydroxyphosphoribosylaminopyrimidine deaminase/5-amino-6-(5-phosphoribosylamino)uracil reductase